MFRLFYQFVSQRMALSGGLKCMKFTLFFLNVLFWMAGSVFVAIGIWSLASKNALWFLNKSGGDVWQELIKISAIVMISLGALLLIVCFLGCFGAVQENACMLAIYAAIMASFIVLELSVGILAAIFQKKVKDKLEAELTKTVEKRYGAEDRKAVTDSWDFLQEKLRCCGATTGPGDWKTSRWKQLFPTQVVPESCCVKQLSSDIKSLTLNVTACRLAALSDITGTNAFIHTEACLDALKTWVWDHATILLSIAFAIASLQVFGVIAAFCIQREVRNKGTFA